MFQRRIVIGGLVLALLLIGVFLFLQREKKPEGEKTEEIRTQEERKTEGSESSRLSVAMEPGMIYPPYVHLTGPKDFLERAARCQYGYGFWGPGGIGVTVEWGDGTTSPDHRKVEALSGQSCAEEVTRHQYSAPGTYTISVRLWHPGPTDASVTEWKDTREVTVP